ncbi:receptor-like protein 54 [Rosa rugosa]|uniref:receptor-like protein 54 n=1 Tax=Rosa rugosa TaxID=74645 RepID=UPI002B408B8D|nr:receptor-like protein 54 [Rosa rugosa]
MDLKALSLDGNGLTGMLDIFKVQNLTLLHLGDNKLEVITESKTIDAIVLPMYRTLDLASCNIKEFPYFIRYQQNLHWLDLSRNTLHGQVPKWMWNISTQILEFLDLSGFDQLYPVFFPWVNLQVLRLHSNMLDGPIPIPASNIILYTILDNKLVGEISPLICNMSTLQYLDLSNNKLNGVLPECLGNFSDDLRVLNLRNKSFQGILPQTYTNRSNLKMIDVSENKLQELKLLAMRHNGFYGVIGKSKKNLCFPELRILDLSHNKFSSKFPYEFIFFGNAMRCITVCYSTYMYTYSNLKASAYVQSFSYEYTITITNKDVDRYYQKIQEDLGVVDISSNKYEGNLTLLESLDLSQNKLCGAIPHQLTQLTFLAEFNVSHSNLTGPIPDGTQFTTFDHTSYEENTRLCRDALPKKCGIKPKTPLPPTATFEENDLDYGIEFYWKFVLAGFASRLVVGVVLADAVITRHELFIEIVAKLIKVLRKRPEVEFKRSCIYYLPLFLSVFFFLLPSLMSFSIVVNVWIYNTDIW